MTVQTQVSDLPEWMRNLYMGDTGVPGMQGLIPSAFEATRTMEGAMPTREFSGVGRALDPGAYFDVASQALQEGIGSYAPYLESAQGGLGTAAQFLGSGETAIRAGLGAASQFPGAYGYLQQSALESGDVSGRLRTAEDMYSPTATQAFMDPYIRDVVEAEQREMQRLADIQRQGIRAQAVGAGAFGGSREGIQQAELTRNLMDQQSRLSAQLMSQGYTQAQANSMAAFEAAQQRRMQGAQVGLQQADLQRQLGMSQGALAAQEADIYRQAGLAQGALGEEMGSLAGQQLQAAQVAQQLPAQDVSRLLGMTEYQRGLQQQQQDINFANRMAQWQQPMQQTQWMADILRGVPSGQTTLTQVQQPQQGWGTQAVGLGLAGLGLFGGGSSGGFGFGQS